MKPTDLQKLRTLATQVKQGNEISAHAYRFMEKAMGVIKGESLHELADRTLGDFHARRGPFAPA